jgi:hypothetical protein
MDPLEAALFWHLIATYNNYICHLSLSTHLFLLVSHASPPNPKTKPGSFFNTALSLLISVRIRKSEVLMNMKSCEPWVTILQFH